MRGRGVFLMAAAGVVLLIGMAAGLFLKGGGARAGREYIAAEAIAGAEENKEENGDVGQNPMEEQGDLPGQNSQGGQNGLDDTAVDADIGKPGEAASSEIVMLFAGDVYLSDHVLNAYDKAGGIHGVLDEGIRA